MGLFCTYGLDMVYFDKTVPDMVPYVDMVPCMVVNEHTLSGMIPVINKVSSIAHFVNMVPGIISFQIRSQAQSIF